MKLFEYQAKALFAEVGIPTPAGEVIENIDQLDSAIEKVGLPCVLKSQVLSGGRGKAGLIQFATTKKDAHEKTKRLFESPHSVRKILVEQNLDIAREIYLAITVDPLTGKALVMASGHGGVEIETLAKNAPEKIVRQRVDIARGIMPYQARNIIFGLDLPENCLKPGCGIVSALLDLFKEKDAELAEINPLALSRDGALIAADAKFSIDDSSAFRQGGLARGREQFENDLEYEASEAGFPYLHLGGDIGLMCAGAGLTNTVYDLIVDYGGTVANYLEFGGPNYRRAVEAMEFTLKSDPKVILIVTFGTIARADVMAEGIVEAIEKLRPRVPIVTAIRGTNEERANEILAGLGLETLAETEQAVRRAIELCTGGAK